MKTRYYFTDITKALYMAKHFGWRYEDLYHVENTKVYTTYIRHDIGLDFSRPTFDGKFTGQLPKLHLKPEHHADLEPQEGDKIQPTDCMVNPEQHTFYIMDGPKDLVHPDAVTLKNAKRMVREGVAKIIQRNNKQWFMPESEVERENPSPKVNN